MRWAPEYLLTHAGRLADKPSAMEPLNRVVSGTPCCRSLLAPQQYTSELSSNTQVLTRPTAACTMEAPSTGDSAPG